MLRNLFEEKKGEANPARENFFALSFDEFLKELDMSEEDYLLALRSGVSGNGYMFMKRSCKEVYKITSIEILWKHTLQITTSRFALMKIR